MAMGMMDNNSFEEELKRLSGPIKPVQAKVEVINTPGRKLGDNNVPDSLRKVIAEDALMNGRQSALGIAKDFGLSSSSVSAYTKGATSTDSYNRPSKSIIGHINQARRKAIKRASKTLNGALEAITQDKLDYTDAKDLSVIAKNMSGIIRDLEPPQQSVATESDSKTPQFVIYAPTFKTESQFDVIRVKE